MNDLEAEALLETLHTFVGIEGLLKMLEALDEDWTPADREHLRLLRESVRTRQSDDQ